MEVQINLVAIFAAAIVSMAIGALWYSPILFGKQWMKLMGYKNSDIKRQNNSMVKTYLLNFALILIMAFVLSHVLTLFRSFYYEFSPYTIGTNTAFWLWLGFIMPIQAMDVIYSKKPWKLFVINTGYQYFSLIVMAVIIAHLSS